MGRFLMKVQDCNGQERYVDVPHLWSVEPDERIFEVVPPPEWHFQAGQRLTLIDDDLMRWAVEVIEDTHEDWELPCRILGPSFMVERFGLSYDDADVILDVPRHRLIDEERLAALDRVDETVNSLLDPKTGLLRKLSFDECQAAIQVLTAVRNALGLLFGNFVPCDSHVGHYDALCEQYLWDLERWLQRMPKQMSLFSGTNEPPKKRPRAHAVSTAVQLPAESQTEQMTLFS